MRKNNAPVISKLGTDPSLLAQDDIRMEGCLMNNVFVLRMADYFAERVRDEAGGDVASQVNRAWQLAIARDPNDTERALSEKLVVQYGLSALCRGLFNVNEFVVIE